MSDKNGAGRTVALLSKSRLSVYVARAAVGDYEHIASIKIAHLPSVRLFFARRSTQDSTFTYLAFVTEHKEVHTFRFDSAAGFLDELSPSELSIALVSQAMALPGRSRYAVDSGMAFAVYDAALNTITLWRRALRAEASWTLESSMTLDAPDCRLFALSNNRMCAVGMPFSRTRTGRRPENDLTVTIVQSSSLCFRDWRNLRYESNWNCQSMLSQGCSATTQGSADVDSDQFNCSPSAIVWSGEVDLLAVAYADRVELWAQDGAVWVPMQSLLFKKYVHSTPRLWPMLNSLAEPTV